MLEGFHPDGEERRNSLLSPPSDPGIVALPENPFKARPLRMAELRPLGLESKNILPEVMGIRWHMGFSEPKKNYNAVGQAMEKYPVVLALYEADLEAAKILEADS